MQVNNVFSAAICNTAAYYLCTLGTSWDWGADICCAGHCPCSGRMKEQECPEVCLAAEVGRLLLCIVQFSLVFTRQTKGVCSISLAC